MAGGAAPAIPYSRHQLEEEDVAAVVAALRGERITTGEFVAAFESAFAKKLGVAHAVSFSSGTAALHGAAVAVGLSPGREAVTTSLTFAATANVAVHCGARVLFADVNDSTLTLDPACLEKVITPATAAVLPVDYAGHPADLEAITAIAHKKGAAVIEDACHALGALSKGVPVGGQADITVFSFHPVKHITTGEGGMAVTANPVLADRMRSFRNHGIDLDADARARLGVWAYDISEPGLNYRLPDINAALGLSQLTRLDKNIARRLELAAFYDRELAGRSDLRLPVVEPWARHAYHLYPVRVAPAIRDKLITRLRTEGIGANLHYPLVHLLGFYRSTYGHREGDFPVAEAAGTGLLSLPMFHALTDGEAVRVADTLLAALEELG